MVEPPRDGTPPAQVRFHELVLGALDHWPPWEDTLSHELAESLVCSREAKTFDGATKPGRPFKAMDLRHGGIDEYPVNVQLLQLDGKAIHQFL